jgi:uncharacterized repeat protein (TIGR03803 family)
MAGGTNGHNGGTIYQWNPSTNTETVLYSFCQKNGCTDGAFPVTPLVQHTNGKFYGNTSGNSDGGAYFYSFDIGLGPFVRTQTQSAAVGSKVSFLGQTFNGATKLSFNGASATFTVVSDTYLTAVVAAAATTGPVTVGHPRAELSPAWPTSRCCPRSKASVRPAGRRTRVGIVTGSGFTGATKVTVSGKTATFTVNSSSQISLTVPSDAKTGKIEVTTPRRKRQQFPEFHGNGVGMCFCAGVEILP